MSIEPGTPDELLLIGYGKLNEHGFALPCFGQTVGANTVYVARSSRPGDPLAPIAAFEPYEAEELRPYPHDKGHHKAKIGDPWIDVFLWRGDLFAGAKPDIWSAVKGIRDDIAANAPLSLLNLAEGVAGLSTGPLARAAFAWLEAHRGVEAASEWRIETYLRGIAIRNLLRRQSDATLTGQLRRDLQNVELTQSGTTLTLHLPDNVRRVIPSQPSDFDDLLRAARAFGLKVILADTPIPVRRSSRSIGPAVLPALLMRLRKGRSDTQTQIPFRLFDSFFNGEKKIRSAHSGRTRAMTQSSSSGRRNTMKFQIPEMKNFSLPVARIENTPSGLVYEVYDFESPQGQKIMSSSERRAAQRNNTGDGCKPRQGHLVAHSVKERSGTTVPSLMRPAISGAATTANWPAARRCR